MAKDPQHFDNLQRTLKALRTLPVFKDLSDAEFRLVADLIKPAKFSKAKFVTALATLSELDLFVMRKGRAALRKQDKKYMDDVQHVFGPGDMMNLEAFVSGKDSNETIEALSELDVWVIPHDPFVALLAAHPELKSKLGTLKDVTPFWANQAHYSFVPEKGEVVIVYRTKHWYVLLTKLVPAIFMLLLGLIVWQLPAFWAGAIAFAKPLTLGAGLWGVITLLFVGWQLNDWHDDFYAVTNRRVIHQEKVLFFSNRQAEAPVAQIRSVIAKRAQTLAYSLLNVGDVTIETLNSYHPITFAHIEKPEEVSRVILEQVKLAKVVNEAAQRDVIRSILRQQMNLVDRPGNMPSAPKLQVLGYLAPPPPAPAEPKPLPYRLGNFFFPRARVKDDRGNITYRHHPLQLFQTAGMPLLSIAVYFVVVFASWQMGVLAQIGILTAGSLLLRLILIGLVLAILLVLVVWFVFRYEDWRNDLFLLTRDKIIDIDRTPFGLQGIQENVSPLDKLQNVTSQQNGFLEWLFDMGDVIIETGGDKRQVFARVKDPRQVQRDIADYMAQLKANEKANDIAQRNKELSEWISIYNEMLNLPYDRKDYTPKK